MSTPAVSDKNAPYFQALVPGEGLSHFKNFTNTNSYSADLDSNTTLVELFPTQDCWVRIVESGSSDTAAIPSEAVKGSSKWCPGGIVSFIGIPKKNETIYKLAVVRNSSNGVLYITEGA